MIEEVLHLDKRLTETGRGIRLHKSVSEEAWRIETTLKQQVLDMTHVPINAWVTADALPVQRQEGPTLVLQTDVEVDAIESQGGKVSDDAFRQHWQSNYAGSGQYEDYAQAYRYGASLAGNKHYHGYRWDELEPRIRSDWEATYAGSPWDRTRRAIRYGWESTSGS